MSLKVHNVQDDNKVHKVWTSQPRRR